MKSEKATISVDGIVKASNIPASRTGPSVQIPNKESNGWKQFLEPITTFKFKDIDKDIKIGSDEDVTYTVKFQSYEK